MKHKDIIILLFSAFLLVMAWVTFNIYHNLATSTTQEVLKKETLPINPRLDETTINKLKNRTEISPAYYMRSSSQSAGLSVSPTEASSEGGKILP